MKDHKIKIGLEIHVQLDTESKLFCSCRTRGDIANDSTCPTCLGLPGSKPTLNKKVVDYALKLALASRLADASASAKSCSVSTTRMPLPPPPALALSNTG